MHVQSPMLIGTHPILIRPSVYARIHGVSIVTHFDSISGSLTIRVVRATDRLLVTAYERVI